MKQGTARPVEARKVRGAIRIVERGTRRIARNAAGTPLDGGGHVSWIRARRQAAAVNAALVRSGRLQPPSR